MDSFVKIILEEWGLPNLTPLFEEEGFDKEAFESLDYEGVKNLIKKQGPRAIFWANFVQKYKNIQLSAVEESNPGSVLSATYVSETESIPSAASTAISATNDPGSLEKITNQLIFLNEPFSSSVPLLNISTSDICGNIVKLFLKSTEGKIVESFYEKNSRKFDGQHRNILAKVIIYKEYEYQCYPDHFKITTERFKKFLEDIVEIFPSEESVKCLYFTPYDKITHKNAHGKLWDHYNHLKQKLGKIEKSRTSIPTPTEVVEPRTLDKIEFLKKYFEPWDKIRKIWNETRSYRYSILEKSDSIYKYFETFPILKSDKGSILLCEDFDNNYTENANKFCANWPPMEQKLIELSSKKLKNNSEISKILNGDCTFKGFLLLANFLSNSIYAKGGNNKRRKLTKKEVLNSFLFLQENATLVLETKNLLKGEALRDKKTLQPRIILIGKSYDKIEKGQVLVDDTLYTFKDTLMTVDCCFKIYSALSCCYPDETKPIWTFLQKYIYGITTKFDQNFNSVTSLFDELSNLKHN